MATELLLSGQCPPDCGDPCVSNAPLGSTYLCVPPSDPDLLFRTVVSDPCQASDWVSICDVCTVDAQTICDIVANNCPHMTMVDNGDGTYTINDPTSGATVTVNRNANKNFINSETGGNAPTPPVAPANPPAPATEDDTLIEVYDDSIVYWTYTGGNWVLTSQFSGQHTQTYFNDRAGNDAPTAPVAPTTPPPNPVENDTLLEFYDDQVLYWKYDGATWTEIRRVPVCCPDVATVVPNAAFVDPAAPTTAEVVTWITNNGPFQPSTLFVLAGGGTTADPDWAWYYDGTTTTRVESVSTPTVDQPLRILGADTGPGTGGAAQPTTADPVLVTDAVQHIGDTFLGGAVGDVMDAVAPVPMVQIKETLLLEQDAGIDAIQFLDPAGGADQKYFRLINRVDAPGVAVGYMRIFPAVDAKISIASGLVLTDRQGNAGFYNSFNQAQVGTTFRVWTHQHEPGTPTLEVIPPAAPFGSTVTHHWTLSAPTAEAFVMDGLNNVTQLSAHPAAALDLMPPPPWMPNPVYDWSYNLTTRQLTGGLNAGNSSQYMTADIDTGAYSVMDADGVETSSGTDTRLQYGARHAPDPELDAAADGNERWNILNKREAERVTTLQSKWDADDEQVKSDYTERPDDFVSISAPSSLKNSIGWDKKNGKSKPKKKTTKKKTTPKISTENSEDQ